MSARGWAGTLERAATVLQAVAVEHLTTGRDAAEQDVAALRELAALLEREVTLTTRDGVAITMTAEQLLNAVTRGPAEQQETGR